jgi:hypothetical protein
VASYDYHLGLDKIRQLLSIFYGVIGKMDVTVDEHYHRLHYPFRGLCQVTAVLSVTGFQGF